MKVDIRDVKVICQACGNDDESKIEVLRTKDREGIAIHAIKCLVCGADIKLDLDKLDQLC